MNAQELRLLYYARDFTAGSLISVPLNRFSAS